MIKSLAKFATDLVISSIVREIEHRERQKKDLEQIRTITNRTKINKNSY